MKYMKCAINDTKHVPLLSNKINKNGDGASRSMLCANKPIFHINGFNKLSIYCNFKNLLLIVFSSIIIMIYFISSRTVIENTIGNFTTEDNQEKEFLVNTENCRIPYIEIYDTAFEKKWFYYKYNKCQPYDRLTSILFADHISKPILFINDQLVKSYTNYSGSLNCCYTYITRTTEGDNPDDTYSLGDCICFSEATVLEKSAEFTLVECTDKTNKTIYSDMHVKVPDKPNVTERLRSWQKKATGRAISVLLIGIDSMSRQNFHKMMPTTWNETRTDGWFELAGYNKIEDNTFPNLMAVLSGYNLTTAENICDPKTIGKFEECPLLWSDYQRAGYVTAYAEDSTFMSTFNYLKKGFFKPPTDYYLRPAILAAEKKLEIQELAGLKYCLGHKHAAEYVYDYAVDITSKYSKDPVFGLFWTNSFSHNAFNTARIMDKKMQEYLEQLQENGFKDNGIIVLFSDHGMRYGPTRSLPSGHLEERLPFITIWLPPWFRQEYPGYVYGLVANKHRLTTPYDLHMTLKHILELSGRVEKLPNALDCPKCQTLFRPVPLNRTCKHVAIEDHWCTCSGLYPTNKNSSAVKTATQLSIDHINRLVKQFENGTKLCQKVSLKEIVQANKGIVPGDSINTTSTEYQIVFVTRPGDAKYESTVHYNHQAQRFDISGTISRLNLYGHSADCMNNSKLQKYCICKVRVRKT